MSIADKRIVSGGMTPTTTTAVAEMIERVRQRRNALLPSSEVERTMQRQRVRIGELWIQGSGKHKQNPP